MPVRMILTEGTVADCTQAHSLIADIPAETIVNDRATQVGSFNWTAKG